MKAMNGEYPFSLWQRADRPNYYVQFKNEKTGAAVHNNAIADMIRRADMTAADAENIIKELNRIRQKKETPGGVE
ncbi:hypothetical protein LQZ19_16375 [Treponema primitia]|uniref:hypothetical protein n=1 Tax=Treponema primitia TaxID=88058 RepID=UPI0039818612